MKKKYEINFLWRKMAPKLVVLQSWKKLQVLERKKFSKKKVLPAYLYIYDVQNGVRKFFSKKLGLEIFNFRKLLIKLDRQKNQENSAHRFRDNYLTNHLVKFL